MHARRPRQGFFWPGASFILLFNGLLFCWLLVKPGGHDLTVAVDDILQVLGPLLALPLCLVGGRTGGRAWRGHAAGYDEHPGVRPARHWAPVLLGLGVLSFAVGQGIWAIYELVLHREVPFPSLADLGYLAFIPLTIAGMLSLPAAPARIESRLRTLLDGLMVVTSLLFVSWALVIGPTYRQASGSIFENGIALGGIGAGAVFGEVGHAVTVRVVVLAALIQGQSGIKRQPILKRNAGKVHRKIHALDQAAINSIERESAEHVSR